MLDQGIQQIPGGDDRTLKADRERLPTTGDQVIRIQRLRGPAAFFPGKQVGLENPATVRLPLRDPGLQQAEIT